MAQNFPSNPTLNTSYTVNNESWTYDGSGWTRATTATANAILPTQTGNSGKYLTTDGTTASWGTVAAAVPKITSIPVTDSSYTVLDDTAVSTGGGYIKIIGTGFTTGSQVLVGTVAATSVSFTSSTELRAQVPATTAGTYVVYVVATDGAVAIRVNGITFSATPTWSTGSSLGSYGTTISIQLAATSDTTITYSLAVGSTLPTGLTLSSSGLLSGTVTGVTVDTVYNFTVNAVDLENQDSPRAFTITISVKDPNFPYVPLLLETAASSTRSTVATDSSTNAFTVTRAGSLSTGWTSPYQTVGYWSNYFDASRLALAYSAASNISSGDFTIEFFVNAPIQTAANGVRAIAFFNGAPSTTASIGWDFVFGDGSTNAIRFEWNNGSSGVFNLSTVGGLNSTWNHIAVTRSGSLFTLFLNGVSQGTSTSALSSNSNAAWATYAGSIGTTNTGAANNLYISNFRIVKGQALATANFTPPTSPLTTTTVGWTGANAASSLTGTVPILTCQNNKFIDNSTNNLAITLSSTPQTTPYFYPSTFAAPAASLGAGYFGGSDYLTVPSNTALNMSSSDFTIEGWYYPMGNATAAAGILSKRANNGTVGGVLLYYGSTGLTPSLLVDIGGAWAINTASTIAFNSYQWNHFAIVRNGSAFNLYINGVSGVSATNAGAVRDNSDAFAIGADGASGQTPINTCYISNFRVVKGTAVYTGTFTPPTNFVTQTGGTYPSTTNVNVSITAANTSLLINLADSNYTSATNAVQNNTFIDSSNYGWPITRSGTPTQGSVTPYWPNGYWSNYFDSTAYLSNASSSAFTFAAADFTVEYWAFCPSLQGVFNIVCGGNVASATDICFGFNGTGSPYATHSANWPVYTTTVMPTNTWVHIAFTRTSGTWKIYMNGVDVTFASQSNPSVTTSAFGVGARSGGLSGFIGYVSNLRVIKGQALNSTGNFTPPTSPVTSTTVGWTGANVASSLTGTVSLLTCQSNRFIDGSPSPITLTVNNSPKIQAFQPLSPPAAYTPAAHGGSGYFESSQYLVSATSTALQLGTSDFTIEFYAYIISAANTNWIFRTDQGSAYSGIMIYSDGTNFLVYGTTNSGSWDIFNAATITSISSTLNRWTHFAIVRSGTSIKIYVNGVQTNTATTSGSIYQTSNNIAVGNLATGTNYFSNLRVVKGTAVYTGAFTPPTLAPLTTAGLTSAASYSSTTNVNTTFGASNASLLLNYSNAAIYDGAVQSNAITVGDAQASTTQFKWSPTSMKFDGTGDYLQLASNPAFAFGNGPFTVEGWFYFPSVPTNNGLWQLASSAFPATAGLAVAYVSGSFQIGYGATSTVSNIAPGTITANNWIHIALVRNSSNNLSLYVNGTGYTAVASDTTNYTTTTVFIIAGYYASGYVMNGYIQDFRVTKGVARYTSNFSVPTTEFITR